MQNAHSISEYFLTGFILHLMSNHALKRTYRWKHRKFGVVKVIIYFTLFEFVTQRSQSYIFINIFDK